MKRFPFACAILVALASPTLSADLFPRVPPTPPDKAEATFETLHGFRMELIAAEPLVVDPVDMAIDEDGRAYVVEMRDYPYPEEKNAEPKEFPGTVRLLEDENGDGKFDKATVFADHLAWPTSVCCYKGGVFVAAAPDIWYFKDTDGNRIADVRRKVFTGFGRYNVQAIMNSLRWGLDNKIYGAAAGNGGTVRHAERPDDPLIQLTRRDFRFDPVTEKIEAIAGGERFGACFDDWGNRFLCNIRNPVQHVVLPLEYVQRNPHLVVPSLIHDCAESGDQLRVFRLSPPEPWRIFRAQRWSLEGVNYPRSELIGAGFWTSSSGVCVYRGAAYPEQFRGNVFIGEVAGNLVHRQILERDGVTFKSRRADENTEFVRSRDNWFRPVNFINAPDGTLHVLDMYRETIEHPWSIPDDIKAQLDLSSGNDRGRLYRLAPPGFSLPNPPRLSEATTAELVANLESPHGWWRETAQRLLFERKDEEAVEPLRKLLRDSKLPHARLHAIHLLVAVASLEQADVQAVINDPSPDVRRQLLITYDKSLLGSLLAPTWLGELAKDSDLGVRFQVALDLSRHEELTTITSDHDIRPALIADLARRDGHDPWMQHAVLVATNHRPFEVTLACIREIGRDSDRAIVLAPLAERLGMQFGGSGLDRDVVGMLRFLDQDGLKSDQIARVFLSGMGNGLARKKQRLADFLPEIKQASEVQGRRLQLMFDEVLRDAKSTTAPPARRAAAISLAVQLEPDSSDWLWDCIGTAQSREVRRAALNVLQSQNKAEFAAQLITCWKQLSPPLRDEAVSILLSRPIWHEALVAALGKGQIPAGQVSIPHRARLTALPDKALAERAKAALAAVALGPRKETIDKYQAALSLKGDSERGKLVYRRECANCHRMNNEGNDVGPSLATVQHRSPQEILIHVLDPSREVSPQFLDYAVRLTDGRVVTGMIASETDAGLTLRRAEKQEESILRSEIDEITSSGKSLMPDGMEQKIKLEEMADLIAYLKRAP